jgi:cobalt-zinc-cadmium efflux system outer membrane protein
MRMFRTGYCHVFRVFVVVFIFVSQAAAQSSTTTPLPRRLTLPQAETLLIERNLSVLAARYQVDVNRAARLIAGYRLNPSVTVGAEQIPFYSPIAGSFPRFFTTNPDAGANPVYTVRVDQIIERGGKRELRSSVAEEQLKASEAQLLDAIRTQIFQVRRAFNAATLARENLKLAEEIERQYTQTETLTQAKADQGDIARVEIYRAAAGRLQYQQSTLIARTAYDAATRDVLNLLGASASDVSSSIAQTTSLEPLPEGALQFPDSLRAAPLELVAEFDDHPLAQSLSELRSIALAERPDVIAARHLLASAESNTQLALAQRERDVDVGYEYQRVGNDSTAGVVVQVPLFVHNNQRTLFTQAEAQKRVAEAQLKQAEIQATTDVDKAYQSYLNVRKILDLYSSENLQQLERLRNVATVSYKEGASSLFELLDAQRAYNAAMTSYNQARADYEMSLWELEQAAGRSLRGGQPYAN